MSFGPDANAFTDFRRTAYTFHVPVPGMNDIPLNCKEDSTQTNDEVLNVLDVLYQLAFKALLTEDNINSERGAVLSELAK